MPFESLQQLLPVHIKAILEFLNQAQTVDDLTNIQKYRPNVPEEELAGYSIGPQSAQNILDTRATLPGSLFNELDQVLAVQGVGEDKVLDIVNFYWQPSAAVFKENLFNSVLGGNWEVNFWRFPLSNEEYEKTTENQALLNSFVAKKVLDIVRERKDDYIIGALSRALLEKSPDDRVEGLTAQVQFASWWFRFDEDNWFSFENISKVVDSYINFYAEDYKYIDIVFYRGFMNGGTVADGITPDDLVVSLDPMENAITIWGISLFD